MFKASEIDRTLRSGDAKASMGARPGSLLSIAASMRPRGGNTADTDNNNKNKPFDDEPFDDELIDRATGLPLGKSPTTTTTQQLGQAAQAQAQAAKLQQLRIEEANTIRDNFLVSISSQTNTSSPRHGETLPRIYQHVAADDLSDPALLDSSEAALNQAQEAQEAQEAQDASVHGHAHQLPVVTILPPSALRGVDLKRIESRATLIAALTQRLPVNDFNLPKFIYRPDLLDYGQFNPTLSPDTTTEDMQELLEAALVPLSYVEGFPALHTGTPLWARLPFEPDECYAAFTSYTTQSGGRELFKLTEPTEITLQWYHEYYWGVRVRCYDMMKTAHAARVREQRLLDAEDNHYILADKLLTKLSSMQTEIQWETLEGDPKAYVEVLERVIKMQRTALGLLSAAKPEQKSETLELIMRRLSQQETNDSASASNSKRDTNSDIDVRAILTDPRSLATAQELIIRMTQTQTQTRTNPSGSLQGQSEDES